MLNMPGEVFDEYLDDLNRCDKTVVYGSLKRGHWNHRLMVAGSSPISTTAWVEGFELRQTSRARPDAIPFAVPKEGSIISVELYGPNQNSYGYYKNPEWLAALDVLENHPHWYRREIVEVKYLQNESVLSADAWMYVLNPESDTMRIAKHVIPQGIWPRPREVVNG